MNEWNIQSRAHACEACGNAFSDQELYHTLLFDAKQDFRRSDVCVACWQGQFSEGARDRKGFVSHWQGIYHAPAPAPEPIRKDTAESLLRKLIELGDPRHIPAGYILAVMLERKRLLKIKERLVRDGQRVFVYEHSKTGDVFTITDPGLQLNQLDQVQRDVAALLEHGFNPPATPPTASNGQTAEGAGMEMPPAAAESSPPEGMMTEIRDGAHGVTRPALETDPPEGMTTAMAT
jgi:hypothetical protein